MAISTLVIGVGGTGVLAVRALRKLYDELSPNERVKCSFLALDFDRSALMAGDADRRFAELEETEFFYLNPKRIQELLRNLDRASNGEPAWERVLRWFPDRAHVQIPASEVEANGASQMRVLGRLGFFLNDDQIEGLMRRKLDALASEVDSSRLSEEKRVILVSSLAGGTGAGMFIDLAYVARRLDGQPLVYAYLLLPEVFQDVDSGGRIFQNAYACLKELAYLKDQQMAFDAEYYRISPISVQAGTEVPFSRINLCRGEGYSGSAAIKEATIKMAEQILGQLQRTIQEKTLAIASNTVSSDHTDEQRKRRTHVFSSVSSVFLPLDKIKDAPGLVLRRILKALGNSQLLADIEVAGASEDFDKASAALIYNLSDGRNDVSRKTHWETKPEGDEVETSEMEARVRDLAWKWSDRVSRGANAAARIIVDDLRAQLKELRQKAAKGSLEEVNKAKAEAENLEKLILADFSDKTYLEDLERLKSLGSFQNADKELKDELQTHLQGLSEIVSTDQALRRKSFIAQLERHKGLFYTRFPAQEERQKKIAEIRSQLAKAEESLRLSRGIGPGEFLSEFARVSAQSQGKIKSLERALEDADMVKCVSHIFQARVSHDLQRQIEKVKAELAERLKKEEAALVDFRLLADLGEEKEKIPPKVELEIAEFLKKELPGFVEAALKELEETDSPETKQAQLRRLLGKYSRYYPFLAGDFVMLSETPEEAETKIREALVRARQRIFERRTPNPQHKSIGLIMVPQGMIWPRGNRDKLREFLESNAAQVLGCRCQIEDYYGTRIWIYHEDLFNPPEHVRNLDEYFRLYNSQRYKELFHIDRRFLTNPIFGDIHAATSSIAVTCGNPNCRENISSLPRTEIICPGCDNLIRSRCGNLGCTLDSLERNERGKEKSCPSCGNFNHSAWWCCTKHGKQPYEIPIDKERCPKCIEEHQADPFGYPTEKISVRPDLRSRVFCPRCVDIAAMDPSYQAFKIPNDLLPFFQKGVNGHDREKFLELAARYKLPEQFRCPNCRTHLIPVHHQKMKPSCARSSRL